MFTNAPPNPPMFPMNGFKQPAIDEIPVGSIVPFLGKILQEEEKTGSNETDLQHFYWKVCDGSSLNRTHFPELFATLGYLYGGSDETFNLPDLQGMFLRGVGTDDASTEDRTAAKNGSTNGVGSTQDHAVQTHKHQYSKPSGASPGDSGDAFASTETDLTSTPTNKKNSTPGDVKVSQYETRPTNIFVYYLIKCKPKHKHL